MAEAAAVNPERPVAGPRAVWRLVRRRNLALYFVGNALSAGGTWFQNLAASLLVFRLTHSTFLLGVLNFSQFIPILVLAPWAGSAADRYDRRRLLLVTQTVAVGLAGGLAALAWADLVNEWCSRSPRSPPRRRWPTFGSRERRCEAERATGGPPRVAPAPSPARGGASAWPAERVA